VADRTITLGDGNLATTNNFGNGRYLFRLLANLYMVLSLYSFQNKAFWDQTVFGTSLPILLCLMCASAVGTMQHLVVAPYVRSFHLKICIFNLKGQIFHCVCCLAGRETYGNAPLCKHYGWKWNGRHADRCLIFLVHGCLISYDRVLAGFISLGQQPSEGVEVFNPRVFYSVFTALLILPIIAFYKVSTNKIGYKGEKESNPPDPERNSALSMNSAVCVPQTPYCDPSYIMLNENKSLLQSQGKENGSAELSAPQRIQDRTPAWLIYVLAVPTTVETWSIAPSLLPYAAASIGGTCDEENSRTVQGSQLNFRLNLYWHCLF
jgi:hypothetical protein